MIERFPAAYVNIDRLRADLAVAESRRSKLPTNRTLIRWSRQAQKNLADAERKLWNRQLPTERNRP